MILESVWSVLPEGRWESAKALEEASGLDEGTLKRVVDFLVRWEFVESKHFPELQIRRKAGTISPVEATFTCALRCGVLFWGHKEWGGVACLGANYVTHP